MEDAIESLEQLAKAVKQKNIIDDEIADIIGRPAERGHTGEYIASRVFGIRLERSASHKGIDGHFASGNLVGKTVNIKWYGKWDGLLDINPKTLPDFYLVMTGSKAGATSSRGTTRPWMVSHVFLFDAHRLLVKLEGRGIKIGVATSVAEGLWREAEVYPAQRNSRLVISEEQKRLLALFG